MKVAVFSAKSFEKAFLLAANTPEHHQFVFFENILDEQTVALASGFDAVSCFITDKLSSVVLTKLAKNGVKLIALRSAGFNHVDLPAAKTLGLVVTRVPAYSPYSVAEFAVALILTLNRKIHHAYNLVREHNFLLDTLLGFDLHGKTVGVVGTGKIGSVFANIMLGFGCHVLASDPIINPVCLKNGVKYVTLKELCQKSDIISLHCPLNEHTRYLINAETIADMKPGVMLINTSRGAVINTKDIIEALKNNTIGYLGLDVYEEEEHLFFQDFSTTGINDEIFMRLQTFPNVLITGHQAFFTQEALINIASITIKNLTLFETGRLPLEDKL